MSFSRALDSYVLPLHATPRAPEKYFCLRRAAICAFTVCRRTTAQFQTQASTKATDHAGTRATAGWRSSKHETNFGIKITVPGGKRYL